MTPDQLRHELAQHQAIATRAAATVRHAYERGLGPVLELSDGDWQEVRVLLGLVVDMEARPAETLCALADRADLDGRGELAAAWRATARLL